MKQNDGNTHSTKTVQSLNALRALFGDEEQTIVVKVDEHQQLLDYEVRPLADVVADLAINGFGRKSEKKSDSRLVS